MAEITYPTTIESDFERLECVYSVIEQMRLEHNRQGEIARSDWGTYRNKWAEYARKFYNLQLPLLREQNRLKENIILANGYNKQTWSEALELGAENGNQDELLISFFGDKHILKSKPTKATSPLLEQLKAINLDELAGEIDDPTEDFTGYTEDDPNSVVTKTSSTVSWDGLDRDAGTRVYKDKGSGHFGDFEHLVTVELSGPQTTSEYYQLNWMLCNTDTGDGRTTYPSLQIRSHTYNTNYYKIKLYSYNDEGDATGDGSGQIAQGSYRYLTIKRNGIYLTCKIYTDSERTDLEDTLSIEVTTTAFQYVYGLSSYGGGSGNWNLVGSTKDLDLQESTVTEKFSSETGSGVEAKAYYPAGELTGSEGGEGSDAGVLLAIISAPGDSGIGVETSSLDTTEYTAKFGSDTGTGTELVTTVTTRVTRLEAGGGVEAVMERVLMLAESGSGAETSFPVVVWTAVDAGAGIEASVLIPVFFSSEAGLGSDFSKVLKDICGGDGGSGCDALKALIGAMGAGSDMRLHGRSGKVRMPSKGVNI